MTTAANNKENQYISFVDNFVFEIINKGIYCFDEILISLPGIYPITVIEALNRLFFKKKIAPNIMLKLRQTLIQNIRGSGKLFLDRFCRNYSFPIPHPLDYDWRFADDAIERLLKLSIEYSDPTDNIILLGTPTVFAESSNRNFNRKTILFEQNTAITDNIAKKVDIGLIYNSNLNNDSLPEITGKIVICDPPWYMDEIISFLSAASKLCSMDGYLFFSIMPIGTRPTAEHERKIFFELAAKLGFSLLKIEERALPYVSPPFEQNALRTQGLYKFPFEWRRGDLAIFVHKHHRVMTTQESNQPVLFAEETLKGVRIRFQISQSNALFGDPSIKRIVPGDILPSISKRDERRQYANVWTSGNRIFQCQRPDLLYKILHAYINNESRDKKIAEHLGRQPSQFESAMLTSALNQILSVIEVEFNEYGISPWEEHIGRTAANI